MKWGILLPRFPVLNFQLGYRRLRTLPVFSISLGHQHADFCQSSQWTRMYIGFTRAPGAPGLHHQFGALQPVSASSEVREVKELIHTLISIPTEDQKLLHRGKALQDEKLLKDYDIQDGTKLTLVVKKSSKDIPSPVTATQPAPAPLPPVWEQLHTFLKRHFAERDAELVLVEFRKSFEQGLSRLSLDDIDRFAANKMRQRQQSDRL